ncbi:molybdopterin molybdotransferase MoeA [soil metagenome]
MALVPLADARRMVLAACDPLAPVVATLDAALGCVTAAAVTSAERVPPFDNSAMDGFAVLATDTVGASEQSPVVLEVAGTVAAGSALDLVVSTGGAVRIMTGAPMPSGADAVVMVERTNAVDGGARVGVQIEVAPADHIRRAGDDVEVGDTVVAAGAELTAGHLGVLASVGVGEVQVHPRPRVGVLSTGDELVEAGRPLARGQIHDSNRRTLLALVHQAGAVPVDLGLSPDDPDAIAEAIRRGVAGCDALLTSGGVSVGDFDHVKAVLDRLGDMTWLQIAIKPAKPFAFGTVAGPAPGRAVPVFGLPGNPVSSMVSFELLARPGLRQMAGHAVLDRPTVRAVADDGLSRRPDGKVHYVRVVASYGDDGRYHVRSAGGQGSHQLSAMAAANALAVVADGDGIAAGAEARVLLVGEVAPAGA